MLFLFVLKMLRFPEKKIGSFRMVDGEGYPCIDNCTGEKGNLL